jgi:broad specificity phosphatase PhoE
MVHTTTLHCLRHAESTDNAARVYSSRPPGADLSERGRAQADALRPPPGRRLAAVYASTALRALRTATALADPLGLPVHSTPDLLEYDIGALEGTPIPGTGDDPCLAVLRAWIVAGDLTARMADGESGHEVRTRFAAVMTAIAAAHPGENVALVSHVGTLTVGLLALCENLTPDDVWGRPLPNATPLTVTFDGTTWRCARWPGVGPECRT